MVNSKKEHNDGNSTASASSGGHAANTMSEAPVSAAHLECMHQRLPRLCNATCVQTVSYGNNSQTQIIITL